MSDVSGKEISGQDNGDSQGDNSAAPMNLRKVFTVVMGDNSEIRVTVEESEFEDLSEHETQHVVAELMRRASLTLLQESEHFSSGEEWQGVTAPLNPGSLYDDIAFDVAVYISDEGVVVNSSFGRLMRDDIPLAEAVRAVSDAVLSLANQVHPPHDEEGNPLDPETGEPITATAAQNNSNLQAPSAPAEAQGRF